MMTLVWTRSNKIGSKLIRWATGAECSHVAWVIDSRLVFHSTFARGVHLTWLHNFLTINEVVHRIDFNLDLETEEKVFQKLIALEYRKYDWGAFLYLSIRYLLYKLFDYPVPTKNKWSSSHKDLCQELIMPLNVTGMSIPRLDTLHPESFYFYISEHMNGNISNTRT